MGRWGVGKHQKIVRKRNGKTPTGVTMICKELRCVENHTTHGEVDMAWWALTRESKEKKRKTRKSKEGQNKTMKNKTKQGKTKQNKENHKENKEKENNKRSNEKQGKAKKNK